MPFQIVAKTSQSVGEATGEAREFAGVLLRIGRGADSELLLDDPAVQLDHAVIQEVSGVYILRSLGEGEPTFVNDKPAQEVILTSKGTIRIGPYLLEFSRPTMKSPLRIEWKRLRDPVGTDEAAASATLVLPVSPFAAKPTPAGPDATQKIDPITEPKRDDSDKTSVIPPPK